MQLILHFLGPNDKQNNDKFCIQLRLPGMVYVILIMYSNFKERSVSPFLVMAYL